MMSEILPDEASICAMAATALATTSPPWLATSRALAVVLVGLLGVLGVLLHRRGDLFHRGRGLLEARGLLLGALREVGGAGRNLGRRIGDFARRLLDLADDLPDALGRGIGVVLQLGEIALIFGGDALAEIALGERAEHRDTGR